MKQTEILTLYQYNACANACILIAAAQVNTKQSLAPAKLSHGGLRGTLAHIWFAEWPWRKRWKGNSPTEWLTPEDFPTFNSLLPRWRREE